MLNLFYAHLKPIKRKLTHTKQNARYKNEHVIPNENCSCILPVVCTNSFHLMLDQSINWSIWKRLSKLNGLAEQKHRRMKKKKTTTSLQPFESQNFRMCAHFNSIVNFVLFCFLKFFSSFSSLFKKKKKPPNEIIAPQN